MCNSFLISAHSQCGNLKVQMEEHELGSDAGGSSSGSTSSLLSDLLMGNFKVYTFNESLHQTAPLA